MNATDARVRIPAGGLKWRHFILASRSPRRRELLAGLVPGARIDVLPPPHADELGFEGLHTWPAIERRISTIALEKLDTVTELCQIHGMLQDAVIVAADTVIVVQDDAGLLRVLGQPPDTPDWRSVVTEWFTRYYAVRPHWALSDLYVRFPGGQRIERICRTEVEFRSDVASWLDWYLSTEESRGKAGGYAIQGVASVFLKQLRGSLSNVVGLPLESLLEILGPPS